MPVRPSGTKTATPNAPASTPLGTAQPGAWAGPGHLASRNDCWGGRGANPPTGVVIGGLTFGVGGMVIVGAGSADPESSAAAGSDGATSTADVSARTASTGAASAVTAGAATAEPSTSGTKTAYPRVPAGMETGIAHAGWLGDPGHWMAVEPGSADGITSRYGVVPSGSSKVGLASDGDSDGVGPGVGGASDTATLQIGGRLGHSTVLITRAAAPPSVVDLPCRSCAECLWLDGATFQQPRPGGRRIWLTEISFALSTAHAMRMIRAREALSAGSLLFAHALVVG